MTGRDFFVPECSETACLGAAMIGAAGTKEFGTIEEVSGEWATCKEIVSPDRSGT
jgi:sugar (pentulose or hexulose) kinase